jgi:hypothetical protein
MAENPRLSSAAASSQSVRTVTTTPLFRIGTRGYMDDGRVFRYARNDGIALSPGKFCQGPGVGAPYDERSPGVHSIGETEIAVTLSLAQTSPANFFADGFIAVKTGTGAGFSYRIEGSAEQVASDAMRMTLSEGLIEAWDGTTRISMQANLWNKCSISGSTTNFINGVPQVSIPDGTTNVQYFWMQTWGFSVGWDDQALAPGDTLASGATAGQVEVNDGTKQNIGIQLGNAAGASSINDYSGKFLQIAP